MSTNVSKEKREKLIAKITAIKSYIAAAQQDENTAQLLTYIAEIEKDIKGKKYGLVFEEHREAIDEILEQNTPVLTEEKDLFINNGGQLNFLIEGDNLASLQLLEKTHKGKIDLIYIDPPYNTGNKEHRDFVYDDEFIDANDMFRHSKWLSFLSKRLKVAKKLLSERGIIFISIDDNEQSFLKVLCDEIFGVENFIACLPTIMNLKGNQDEFGFAGTHEYTVVYSKNKATAQINQFATDEEDIQNWQEDEIGYYKKGATLKRTGQDAPREKRPYGYFPIIVNNEDKTVTVIDKERFKQIYNPRDKTFNDSLIDEYVKLYDTRKYTVLLPTIEGQKTSWRWSRDKVEKEANEIIVSGDDGSFSLYKKQRPTIGDLPTKKAKTLFYKPEYSSGNGTAQLKQLFGLEKVFNNPKSVNLIYDFISLATNPNSTVLDFFAGSGTTGHAVMKLNAEDGGTRKFILCTNNENNICREVTYERIKRVIARDKYNASLKYYKVDFVPISDKFYYEYADELLKHVRELVELENGVNFTENAEIAIILTEQELDDFFVNMPSDCETIYLGHNVLPSKKQEDLFQDHGITVKIIPDYYYRELEG